MFKNQYSWMQDTKRISIYQIKEVLNLLDEAYFLLETDEEILKEAGKPKVMDLKASQNKVWEAIRLIEEEWEDKALSRIDLAASDIEHAIKKIEGLKIDVELTPKNGMW